MSGNNGTDHAIVLTSPEPAELNEELRVEFGLGVVAWSVIGLIALVLFIARFVGGWWYENWDYLHIGGLFLICGLLLYGSFLIEGIIIVASKVEEFDEDAMDRAMRDRYGPADTIRATLIYVKREIGPILIGQPLVAISITLLFDSIVEMAGLHLDPKGVPVTASAQTLPQWIIWLLSSSLVSGALSAALVYWLGQLLPQLLGKRNAIGFMHLPCADLVARTLVQLSRLGVGTPARILEQWLRRYFRKPIKLPVGDKKIFESLTEDYGYSVERRSITIRPVGDHVEVTDETTYRYRNPRIEIRHNYRIVMEQFSGPIRFDIDFGGTRQTQPTRSQFRFDLSEFTRDAEGTDKVRSIYQEIISVMESIVESGLSEVTTRAFYQRIGLATLPDERAEFAFDMGVPTREVQIRIEKPDGVFIPYEPKVIFTSEDVRFRRRPGTGPELDGWYETVPQLKRGKRTAAPDADGWSIVHTYPPMSAEMLILLNAQAAA
jgi:hypothetical protein